jgi:hypothetical protein
MAQHLSGRLQIWNSARTGIGGLDCARILGIAGCCSTGVRTPLVRSATARAGAARFDQRAQPFGYPGSPRSIPPGRALWCAGWLLGKEPTACAAEMSGGDGAHGAHCGLTAEQPGRGAPALQTVMGRARCPVGSAVCGSARRPRRRTDRSRRLSAQLVGPFSSLPHLTWVCGVAWRTSPTRHGAVGLTGTGHTVD